MNVLLVNTGASSANFATNERRFPIGLGYLSAVLKEHGHSATLVDRFADRGAWPETGLQHVDFVGVYVSTPCFEDALRVLQLLDSYDGPIAFGGPHTTVYPETIPPRVDYVVQGEAEYVINDLVEGQFPQGKLLRTQRINDLDQLPRPDYDLFLDRQRSYTWGIPVTSHEPIFLMNTSRSCPFTCSFCSVRDIWGRLWRSHSPERVVDDIAYLKKTYDMAGVYFREDIFTCDTKRVIEICELIIRKNLDVVWACETRVDAGSDPEFVELMAKSGCKGMYIGAESGSQRMLEKYNKQVSVEQIVKTCKSAKKYGIAIYMSLIVDHPDETWLDRRATRKLIKATRPEIVWKNRYRPEFGRYGTVDYPTYPARDCLEVGFEHGTSRGQHDRLGSSGYAGQDMSIGS